VREEFFCAELRRKGEDVWMMDDVGWLIFGGRLLLIIIQRCLFGAVQKEEGHCNCGICWEKEILM
jgi:hypothetical protein